MFWSGNFMAMRELNLLLKEKDVTLTSVLEADDILQECKADNKALMQFLTRPDILAELITLITEEPPANVEISQQYRHATIACEVLTSHLSTLSDRLTLDTVQMNRLCDFINKDPPLNPLLASYFSKTVEMLLERSPKQDWYLYHIVCLRVLDFFKSRRDFLPNLLRHLATSAVADIFKYFIRLDDLFNKPVMEWLEEHQFIDSLIQIICGTYVPEHFPAPDELEKGQREASEKDLQRGDGAAHEAQEPEGGAEAPGAGSGAGVGSGAGDRAAVAAANAAALLTDLLATGCAGEGCSTRSRTAWQLASALGGCGCVRSVLCQVFTCPPRHRAMALHHAARLLLALAQHHTSENEEERCSVELAVAPHLPLLHQALLHDPERYKQEEEGNGAPEGREPVGGWRVGAARVSTAALLARLALSEVEEVASTMLTLGTPGVLLDMMFQFPDNNFLHAQVLNFCRNALSNHLYCTQYARHLFEECDLLTRLMDAFEENENNLSERPRAGYMGHVVELLMFLGGAAVKAPLEGPGNGPGAERWWAFRDEAMAPRALLHRTPLGGSYPSDNSYEVNEDFGDLTAAGLDELGDDLPSDHEMRSAEEHAEGAEFEIADGLGLNDSDDKLAAAQTSFFELANQRIDDDMWEEPEAPLADVHAVLSQPSPWESGGAEAPGGEGWAQFDAFCFPPAAPPAPPTFAAFWPYESDAPPDASTSALEEGLRRVCVGGGGEGLGAGTAELANNLLTAMSAMSPAAIANIVNANLQPLPLPPASSSPAPEPPRASSPSECSSDTKPEAAEVPVPALEDAPTPVSTDPPPTSADPPATEGDARLRGDTSPPAVTPVEGAAPAGAGSPAAAAAPERPSYASVVNNDRVKLNCVDSVTNATTGCGGTSIAAGASETVDGPVGASETVDGPVGASETVDGRVGASETVDGRVGASETVDGPLGASETVDGPVGASETVDGRVGASETVDGPVGASETVDGPVGASETVDGRVGASETAGGER